MKSYDPTSIEQKWQKDWAEKNLYTAGENGSEKDNFYMLVEFPYPSGDLHTGHWYAFSVPDIFVRLKRMKGENVLFPIGFDAFGLPAENAAIKRNVNPREWTEGNITTMRKQLEQMGASFDWSREVVTCRPEYYKWTQWLFLQLFERGLAYQAETAVNWCASCKTVLANEQVVGGVCERCGNAVEERKMKQWMLRITDYAESLLEGLDELDWPEEIKAAQRNWIGKSTGAVIKFQITNNKSQTHSKEQIPNSKNEIEVFTTRPDTLFGATFVVLGPEHELLVGLQEEGRITNIEAVQQYIATSKKKTIEDRFAEKEKTGVRLEGVTALNPATGKEIPIFVADYVLGDVGTGAIMAVPAHDTRDWEFAQKFDLPIVEVIAGGDVSKEAYVGDGELVNSGEFTGQTVDEAKEQITKHVGGELTNKYRLRDWVVSRQRYWGCPIPIVHCAKCGAVPISAKNLPVALPDVEDYLPTGDGESPLAKATEWVKTTCPKCEGEAKRETDTLDTFIDSSWYFLRYIDPKNTDEFSSKDTQKHWMPVELYSGGAEHTTMHLLYSRFFQHALHDLGLVVDREPYKKRMNRSIILGPDGAKMSKSKGNVINPDEYVQKLGADTVRMYLGFIGPYDEVGSYPWNPDSIIGIRKFLDRLWRLQERVVKDTPTSTTVERMLHQTIQKVEHDVLGLRFNTAISALMILLNTLEKEDAVSKEVYKTMLRLFAPFVPHITEELWELLGEKGSIHESAWPIFDSEKAEEKEITIAIQVNGKVRDTMIAGKGTAKDELEQRALGSEKVQKHTEGKTPKKVIVVPDRLVNIVV